MPRYCPRCGEALHSDGTTKGEVRKTARRAYEPEKKPRKVSAYHKAYGSAFKRIESKYKLKNGKWGKNGFKRAAAEARRIAKKETR
jgi:DNA-directed RNA polymerase subunit M/transcription elongation factor TFIIS